ncbi:efflux RND transporter permease subunit [Nocardioides jishulii]|uniref:Efflux RND transporter permease subunit n=1 Tax=Nocardioides jishulii TaxID=2575440 RepID=A0A4U2YJH7_9ACTN|nr:efflux RND transporter permease subunit [Nocardioides jishulii]QCX26834.1 efflux RND transporter permease subunit [Nocardioides jishulii]TKI61317.1 efflux RND transporter permease subunit [Nocardioides jishulii]
MGSLASFSLRNRAFVALATVIVAIFGGVALGSLKLELIPNLQFPLVGVVAPYAGASPEAVEQEVTVPIEEAVAGVDGLDSVSSTSSSGAATVLVSLDYGTDLDRAVQQVESAMVGLRTLPESVDPVVFAGDISQVPIVQLSITSDRSPSELADELEQVAVPEFSDIEGVREVQLSGAPTNRVEITLKPQAAAEGVTGQQVSDALKAAQMVPAGSLDDGDRALSVQVGTTPTSLAELKQVPVKVGEGTRPLGTLAQVKVGQAAPTSYARTNGDPSLSLAVTKTPDGNTVDISHAVNELIPELEEKMGDGTEFSVAFDQAPFIEKSVEDLTTEGGLGLIFAIFVILVFLHSLRSTIVTAISIPLSLLVTLIGLWVGGYSLNILTLGALTVAIGRVVDDSIVVIENIKRHLAYGEGKIQAIVTAVREVAGAITSSTIATAAVFLPIGVVGGQVGELFRPFAITVSLALLASLLVALTIIPVLAYWFLKEPQPADEAEAAELRAKAEESDDRTWLRRAYDPVLRWSLRKPWLVVTMAFVILLGTVGLAFTPYLKTNFLGDTGQNTLSINQELEAGASLARQDAAAREVEKIVDGVDGVETVLTTVGGDPLMAAFTGGSGTSFSVTLSDDADATEVTDELRTKLEDADGDIQVGGGQGGGFSSAIDVVVTATEQQNLLEAADQVQSALEKVDGIGELTSDASPAQPILSVAARPQAQAAGLTSPVIGGLLAQTLFQPPVGRVSIDNEQMDVVLLAGPKPTSVKQLEQLPVGPGGTLGQVAEVEERKVAASITRQDGDRTVTISADPSSDDLRTLTADITTVLDDLDLPEGTDVTIGGVAEDQAEAFAQLGLALVVAIAIVYMVMVGTFNSLVQPLILLVSVPFAATGALLLLVVTGVPLGVASLIGALMLIGVVVTNAIVLIDLVNQRRNAGDGIVEALTEGGGKRLRPIVMTALATILALTPMGLGVTGGSAFISQPLAIVVIGGLLSSTVLTLVLVPVLYLLVERRRERRAERRSKKQAAKQAEAATA